MTSHLLQCLLLVFLIFGEPGAHASLVKEKNCKDISAWFKGTHKMVLSQTVQFREGLVVKKHVPKINTNSLYMFICSKGEWTFKEEFGFTETEFETDDYKLPRDFPDSDLYVKAGESRWISCKDGTYSFDTGDRLRRVMCPSEGGAFKPKLSPCGTLEVVKEDVELEWVPLSEQNSDKPQSL
eukprot:884827_1